MTLSDEVGGRQLRSRKIKGTSSDASDQSINEDEVKIPKQSRPIKIGLLIVIGLLFHLVYIMSIFDIYFKSPLVQDVESTVPLHESQAHRLVLVVGDGLRADRTFEEELDGSGPRTPFLNSVIRERGCWGVSHTRVPTESRPCHIAMIAGFYEDVSAVTRGWKENTVPFDHLLRQASYAWAFGSPGVVDLFEGGQAIIKPYSYTYNDFAGGDASQVDDWSVDQLLELLKRAEDDKELAAKLKSKGVMFFLHLSGLDINGHSYGPASPEYLGNTRKVDGLLRKLEAAMNEFYGNDGKSAFVFTADHGMSDGRSHGDGHPDNTRTPLIVWGAGVAGPRALGSEGSVKPEPEYGGKWPAGRTQARFDVSQADLAPLMATLLGLPIPTNNEGTLPLVYLNFTAKQKNLALLGNCRQVIAAYGKKEAGKRQSEYRFVPFAEMDGKEAHEQADLLYEEIKAADDDDADQEKIRVKLEKLLATSLAGLRYLQRYDWRVLRTVIAIGYISWMIFGMIQAFILFGSSKSDAIVIEQRVLGRVGYVLAMAIVYCLFYWLQLKSSPIQYYAYFGFPVLFVVKIIDQLPVLMRMIKGGINGEAIGIIAVMAVGLEALHRAFYDRLYLIAAYVVLAAWSLFAYRQSGKESKTTLIAWLGSCAVMCVFPLLPPIKDSYTEAIHFGTALVVLVSITALLNRERTEYHRTHAGLTGLSGLAAWIVKSTDEALTVKSGLPRANQLASWAIVVVSLMTPFIWFGPTRHATRRLNSLSISLSPALILLSVSYELAFFVALSLHLIAWMHFEDVIQGEGRARRLRLADLRLVFAFLLMINNAFFGTGNISSISSFSIQSVYRFVTLFSPFLMAGLLILKILVPFVLLSAALALITDRVGLPPFALFLVAMIVVDTATLQFFFEVRDVGSWLEIGEGISRFVIASAFIVLSVLLTGIARAMLGNIHRVHL